MFVLLKVGGAEHKGGWVERWEGMGGARGGEMINIHCMKKILINYNNNKKANQGKEASKQMS